MRTAMVRRLAAAMTATLAAAAVVAGVLADRRGPAAIGGPESAPERAGAVAFDAYCGACHEAAALAREWDPATDDATVLAFLEAHGAAPADADRAIVAYLTRLAAP